MTPRPPFRADHVGSLLRPPVLREARRRRSAGEITTEQLKAVEDDAIRDVVKMQKVAGLSSATDGEFRRASWHMDFIYSLGGISQSDERLHVKFHNLAGDLEFSPPGLQVDGRVRLDAPIFAEHFTFLKSHVDAGITPKLTIPSPSMVYYRGGRAAVSETVYPDLEEFFTDLSSAYAAQLSAMGELGCQYLQLDDTSLAYLNDPAQRELVARMGGDPDTLHLRNIKTINAALRGKPDGMTVTTHLCRGNFRSSWAASGSYEFVAEAVFGELGVDGFFLEYDDERSGGFEPLRFVPPGKRVVLGLVTTKRPELEDADALVRRIEEASRFVDIDQLCLSPQCGFSSTEEGNELTTDDQLRKLELIVATAERVWGR
ncbi:5-methyltetrahydropteroyltriglutamate--homocysteine S-methyltransferase [Amycolatopsis sp. FDAARGOS 1241]|uniref:5-methyltetrahydropteroyltriglutamate-- homocysteine S-methyltransferase n=1 Tax=Amycolatopsis sp. FDAARGOS 1241 TaxID=2778070 RepID=UPI0019500AEE|nr:5-methyltetrahydropteroyltriglutamate--homocysteine S-methyltransferase [Amycolatopsis sp. FDAARGOS 1241]QRP45601.1 5-methyltetrahydropteroyltriglutamate--homocysteine S-methyltransferase [Amycolatopsis sp. FDAARGOS 1241]